MLHHLRSSFPARPFKPTNAAIDVTHVIRLASEFSTRIQQRNACAELDAGVIV
ncbi:hypothetical protein [Caballeronia choica]|jgi:hypothetical protein|uniref:hypothetical protein n=1 Tax=Caballeronia choica TaxID=326476 RepID=UPI000B03B978|nr:hypothetical protein [Caballeronia choica]